LSVGLERILREKKSETIAKIAWAFALGSLLSVHGWNAWDSWQFWAWLIVFFALIEAKGLCDAL